MELNTQDIFLLDLESLEWVLKLRLIWNIYQKNLWYTMPYHSGINISMWQSISFLAQNPSIWFPPINWVAGTFCPIPNLTKYHIPNWMRPLDNLIYWYLCLNPPLKESFCRFISIVWLPALTILWIELWDIVFILFRLGPTQGNPFALIIWYVAKTIYLS